MGLNAKVDMLFLVGVIAFAGIGMSYAVLAGEINVNGFAECYCDVGFVSVWTDDNEMDKYVADVSAVITNSGNSFSVSISNAYPGYVAYIDFAIQNMDVNPAYVGGVIIGNYDEDALDIVVSGVNPGAVLYQNGNLLVGTLTVSVLQGVMESTGYPFDVSLGFSGCN